MVKDMAEVNGNQTEDQDDTMDINSDTSDTSVVDSDHTNDSEDLDDSDGIASSEDLDDINSEEMDNIAKSWLRDSPRGTSQCQLPRTHLGKTLHDVIEYTIHTDKFHSLLQESAIWYYKMGQEGINDSASVDGLYQALGEGAKTLVAKSEAWLECIYRMHDRLEKRGRAE
ncbi:MAG: hypothetical protein Q9208_004573 [Pyrenodesmia sp. 3 TL-2023]